jgi:HD-GYP domain-containing protein (c-di-GMP phosphodiesterase class II)
MSFFDEKIQVIFEDMLIAFSQALNLVDERLTDHHGQVAYICYELGHVLGLDEEVIKQLVMLGLVHDVGAFKETERNRMVSFEVENVEEHSITGYLLLKDISFYSEFAEAILYHHRYYHDGKGFAYVAPDIAMLSQLIFLADRVSVLVLTGHKNVLSRVDDIYSAIDSDKGRLFNPSFVKALDQLRDYDYFWLNMVTDNKMNVIKDCIRTNSNPIDYETFKDFTKMFMYSIDFRSRFTATHSRGVAAVAKAIGLYSGMTKDQAQMLEIAGYYHDIGKLMIPYEILDKPSRLTEDEYNLIRQHPYFTYRILDSIEGLEYIRDIAAYHHELIDGKGYPFRLEVGKLSYESKILTVADIFTALTEARPYREQSNKAELSQILGNLVAKGKIDPEVVDVTLEHCETLFEINKRSQHEVYDNFDAMTKEKEVLIHRANTSIIA